MQTKYVVKQLVKTASGNFMHIVSEREFERMALSDYDDFVKQHPDQYFEVLKTETRETCLRFTKISESKT